MNVTHLLKLGEKTQSGYKFLVEFSQFRSMLIINVKKSKDFYFL